MRANSIPESQCCPASSRTLASIIVNILLSANLLILPLASAAEDANFDLQAQAGKVVYLDFWASWCGPCRASFPWMNKIRAQHSADDLAMIAVNVDAKRKDADRFLRQFPANFDIVYDPEGKIATSYAPKGMPTSYLYDRQGKLILTHTGFRKKDDKKLAAAIEQAIQTQ